MKFFLILLFLIFSFHFFKKFLFYLYFWQKKEYKLKRVLSALEEDFKVFFPKSSFFSFLILIFGGIISFFSKTFFFYLVFFYFFYLFLKAIFEKKKFPQFTKKAIFIFFVFLFLYFLLIKNNFSYERLPFFCLILDFILPLFLFLFFPLFQIPTYLYQEYLLKKVFLKRKKMKDLVVIAITGSYGKTSTKDFLYILLSQKFKNEVVKTKKNENTEIAVAKRFLQNVTPKTKFFVAEIGAYQRGEIKKVTQALKPQIAILTGISFQHLSLFGSQKNIILAKSEIFSNLHKDGFAILNGESKKVLEIVKRVPQKKIICGFNEKFDFFAKNIKEEIEFLEFDVFWQKKEKEKIKLFLQGKHQIENFLLAGACAKILGLSLKEIKKFAQKIRPSVNSLRLKKGKNNIFLLEDLGNITPEGILSAIEFSKKFPGKKIILFSCLIELGKMSTLFHKKLGEKIGEVFDLCIVLTPYFFEEVKLGALQKGMPKENIFQENDPQKIQKIIEPYFKKGNLFLLEGKIKKEILNLFY